MKKLLCLLMLCTLCTGCTKQSSKESQPIPPSSESVSTTVETSSTEKKIVPLPSTLKIDSITDATVAASFEPKDLAAASTGKNSLNLTVYDYELFNFVDISTLAVGDTIVTAQKEIKVESMEKTESGLIIINGGIENDGLELFTEDNTVYFESGMDGFKKYYEVGKAPFEFSDDFRFIDNSDLEKPNQELTYEGFAAKLQNEQIIFSQYNTKVLIQNKCIVEITLSYTP